MPIVVVGNVFVDIKGFPDSRYIPAGRNSGWVEIVHGGVGRNVAEDIANVELRPRFVSMVDESPQGEAVLRRLSDHKVDVRYVAAVPDGMGLWLAVHDEAGDIVSSLSKRPRMDAMVEMLDRCGDEIFADADSIVVEIDMDQDVIKRVFGYAEKYGKRVYAVVANMSIATQRRDFLQSIDCFVCNAQEAGILFADDNIENMEPEALVEALSEHVISARIPSMVVTMGSHGAVYASLDGDRGWCAARPVQVRDTSGAGDAFCSGVVIGLTYGKTLQESADIGSRLAASVIVVTENTCPRFLPRELGLPIDVEPES